MFWWSSKHVVEIKSRRKANTLRLTSYPGGALKP